MPSHDEEGLCYPLSAVSASQMAGCRRPSPEEMPLCWSKVPFLMADVPSSSGVANIDAAVRKEMNAIPHAFVSKRCRQALETFGCVHAFDTCGVNGSLGTPSSSSRTTAMPAAPHEPQPLPACRSVCQSVRASCADFVLNHLPQVVRDRLNCDAYPSGSWPSCKAPCTASWLVLPEGVDPRCADQPLGFQEKAFLEAPCGYCAAQEAGSAANTLRSFVELPVDVCGVCNGDGASCGGCDGKGSSLDACGVCSGGSTMCPWLETDSRLLGYASAVGASCIGALFLLAGLVASLRRLRRQFSSLPLSVPPKADDSGRQAQAASSLSAGACEALSRKAAATQARAFQALGSWIGQRPWLVVVGCVFLGLALGSGVILMSVHEDPLSLWLPAGSEAADATRRAQLISGQPRVRVFQLLLYVRGAPVPAEEALRRLMELRTGLQALAGPAEGFANATGSPGQLLGSLLVREFSALELWKYDSGSLKEDGNALQTLRNAFDKKQQGDETLVAALEEHVRLEEAGVRALLMTYTLNADKKEASMAWERAAIAALPPAPTVATMPGHAAAGSFEVHVFCEQLLADELLEAISGDALFMAAGYTLMGFYMSISLGRCRHRSWFDRVVLGVCSVASVMVATAATFGICGAAGVPYNETVNITIFVMMGVGVDDAFVIVQAYDDVATEEQARRDLDSSPTVDELKSQLPLQPRKISKESIARRMQRAMGHCGSAILLSSATNTLAFAVGARTPLPALQSFCIYTSVGMLLDFGFQVTFFVALLTLNERARQRREEAGKKTPLLGSCCQTKSCLAKLSSLGDSLEELGSGIGHRLTSSSLLPLKMAVIGLYVTVLVASVWSAFGLPSGLQVTDMVPAEARSSKFLELHGALWPRKAQLVDVYFQHLPLAAAPGYAFSPLESQESIGALRLLADILRSVRVADANDKAFMDQVPEGEPGIPVVLSPVWSDGFSDYLRTSFQPPVSNMSAGEFRDQLNVFLNSSSQGSYYLSWQSLVPFNSQVTGTAAPTSATTTQIAASKISLFVFGYGVDAMLSIRASVAAAAKGMYGSYDEKSKGHAMFAISGADVYYEQDAMMLRYTLQSLVSVMIAVLVMVWLLAARAGFVAAMAACTLSCCVHMFSWMRLTSTPLNSMSLIPLLLSVGLCIDYCTHMAHAFWDAPGEPAERARLAFRCRGAAVFNGGASTGLTFLVLAFSKSIVFYNFFKMMTGVVVVGLWHALIVLPVILSLMPKGFAPAVSSDVFSHFECRSEDSESPKSPESTDAKKTESCGTDWPGDRQLDEAETEEDSTASNLERSTTSTEPDFSSPTVIGNQGQYEEDHSSRRLATPGSNRGALPNHVSDKEKADIRSPGDRN
eukprot:TRINITY_DN4643_c0_g3_i1.p1 TRINITY_DN4643_c0_g3~~TRINITY_DN4643_c0_g3_i1.p1  ORF type:complete len:1361 (+),score=257.10 TRINITY_DN4643_c0_g3_i1:132-4214(+)